MAMNPNRAGIFSVDPYGPNVMDRALGVSAAIGNLIQNKRMNDALTQKNQLMALQNKYFPQEAQSKIDYTKAMTGLANARQGLLGGGLGAGVNTGLTAGLGSGLGAQNGQTQTNPDGTLSTIESPTTASASLAQNRAAAESEMNILYPVVQKGINAYVGPGGSISLAKDVMDYKSDPTSPDGQAAGQRLYNYALAKRYIPELAGINARQVTGREPGIEVLNHFQNAMFPNMPSELADYLIPNDIHQRAMNDYKPIQQGAVNAALKTERIGFPLQTQQAPAWTQKPIQLNPLGGSNRASFHQGLINTPKTNTASQYSPEKIAYTAKKYGISTDEVKQRLGIK